MKEEKVGIYNVFGHFDDGSGRTDWPEYLIGAYEGRSEQDALSNAQIDAVANGDYSLIAHRVVKVEVNK